MLLLAAAVTLLLTRVEATCPNVTATSGPTWINVEWEVTDR